MKRLMQVVGAKARNVYSPFEAHGARHLIPPLHLPLPYLPVHSPTLRMFFFASRSTTFRGIILVLNPTLRVPRQR